MPYSIQEIGARARAKNPKLFANFTDEQIGQRLADKHPEIKAVLATSTTEKKSALPVQKKAEAALPPQKKGFFDTVKETIASGANKLEEISDKYGAGKQSLASSAIQTAGEAGKAFTSIGVDAFSRITPNVVKNVAWKGIKAVANVPMLDNKTFGESVANVAPVVAKKYAQVKKSYPTATANVEGAANLITALPAAKIAGEAGSVAVSGALKTAEKGTGALAGALEKKAVSKLGQIKKAVKDTASTIVQDKKANLPMVKEVLTKIETKGVKTYEELRGALEAKTNNLKESVNSKLSENKNIYKLDDLHVTHKVGETEVKANFVDKALNHLQELYTSTDDIVSAEKTKQLIAKAKKDGLSSTEINQISRDYGTEFGAKAFNKIGEPLTSVNAQSYENVRKGVKSTVRGLNPKSGVEAIDQELSRTIKVKQMIGKMEENVRALNAKIKKTGKLEKFGRFVGKGAGRIINASMAGAPREFLTSFLPSNIGNKVMNSLDIEEVLAKNLKKLEELNKLDLKGANQSQLRKIESFLKTLQ
jgi:hypothetical protein